MCGFVGIVGRADVAPQLHVALQALQHRGQDSAGIATMNAAGTRFIMRKGLGIAARALTDADLADLDGPLGLGHVRYPTIGQGQVEDAQPFFFRQPGVLMAHNGQVTNYEVLRRSLLERSIHLLSRCDVEPAMCELADSLNHQRPSGHTRADLEAALGDMLDRVHGAFSIVAGLLVDGRPTLVAIRDPEGIRPCVLGRRDDGSFIAASETVALDALGYRPILEPAPGEAVILRAGDEPIRVPLRGRAPAPCVFEHIYFARPDSRIDDRSVYEVRMGLGAALADRVRGKGIEADVVVPVPDTARPAATAMSETLGLPLREGFIKNRYSGRTFIMPDALTRQAALRLKLNTIPTEMRGKRVLLVDDSIVRGTTLARVIELVRDAGPAAVHLAIHSPPVVHPCFYGIDMSTEEHLFARRFEGSIDQIEAGGARALGADSLTYLPVEAMDQVYGGPRCAACFDGRYPQPVTDDDRAALADDRRAAKSG
jgi:amidophosphoribosyltransferase